MEHEPAHHHCSVCGRPLRAPGELWCDGLCAAAWAETARVRFAPSRLPAEHRDTVDRLLRGDPVTPAAEASFYAYLAHPPRRAPDTPGETDPPPAH